MKLMSEKGNQRFVIEGDESGEVFLFVFDAEGECVFDYWEESLAAATDHAEEEFQVPRDSWQKIE